jgi:hypothetical protein
MSIGSRRVGETEQNTFRVDLTSAGNSVHCFGDCFSERDDQRLRCEGQVGREDLIDEGGKYWLLRDFRAATAVVFPAYKNRV